MASLLAAQRARADVIEPLLVHTGQHRDPAMSGELFADLDLPQPDVLLPGCSGTQGAQIAGMLTALEPVLRQLRPDLVVVVGDVNSTTAGALAAAMLGIPVAHVEAGLRSFDRSMPEELNRILVDTVSDICFASEASGVTNLVREGRARERIHHVGNVMIDALVRCQPRTVGCDPAAALGVGEAYAVLTLHRPANVDHPEALAAFVQAAAETARRLPIIFPVHPRTRDRIHAAGLDAELASLPGVHAINPLGYVDMLALLRRATVVITDSGGLQEETTFLGVPCLTLRDNTERPATVTDGTNRVIGAQPQRMLPEVERVLAGDRPVASCPPLWDGHAAERVVEILVSVTNRYRQ